MHRQKNILIIGGNGFIGKNLAEYLADRDYSVFSFDLFDPSKKNPKIKYIRGDFFDDSMLEKIVENMDVVVHALSTVTPGNSDQVYLRGYAGDFIQTIKLCEWIIKEKGKLIFLSSGGTIYGEQLIQPIDEQAKLEPNNHYGNLKLCIENTLRIMAERNGLECIIARISNPYGPGQDFEKGVGFIDAAIKKFLKSEMLEIWGDGEIVRDYIYIDDVSAMLHELVEYEGTEIAFNLSSATGTSQNQIIRMLKRAGVEGKVEYKDKRSIDLNKVVLSNKKICNLYKGKIIGIEEGLRKYCTWIFRHM